MASERIQINRTMIERGMENDSEFKMVSKPIARERFGNQALLRSILGRKLCGNEK